MNHQESIDNTPSLMEPFFYPHLYSELRSRPQIKQNTSHPDIEEECPRGAIPIPKSRKSSYCGKANMSLNANSLKPITPSDVNEYDMMFRFDDDIEISQSQSPVSLRIDINEDSLQPEPIETHTKSNSDEIDDHDLMFSFEKELTLHSIKEKTSCPIPSTIREPLKTLFFFSDRNNQRVSYPFELSSSKHMDIADTKKSNKDKIKPTNIKL